MNDEWLTPDELSKRLNVSKSRVYRLARNRNLISRKEGNRLFISLNSALPYRRPNRSGIVALVFALIAKLHSHPWFVTIAGLSSILGLVLTIYALHAGVDTAGNKSGTSSATSRFPSDPPSLDPEFSYTTDVYRSPLGFYSPDEYRVRYLIFKGESLSDAPSPISGLLTGTIKKTTGDIFNKEPYVLRTEPFQVLERLAARFPEFYSVEQTGYHESSLYNPARVKKKFAKDSNYYILDFQKIPRADKESKADTETNLLEEPFYAFGVIAASNINDLAGQYSTIPEFTKAVTQENNSVEDIAVEELSFSECPEPEWFLQFASRPMKVLALDIENLKTQPITLNFIEGTIQRFPDLHLTPWTEDMLTEKSITRFDFPLKVLAPGEHLIVPMKLILGRFGDQELSAPPESIPSTVPAMTLPDVFFKRGKTFAIRSPEKVRTNKFYNEYVLGPWFEPTLVDTVGNLRPFTRSSLVYGPMGVGSCPYAFLLSPDAKKWKLAGRLIPNRRGKAREGENRLKISNPTEGKILIKELEPEISFLDEVYLEAQMFNGSTLRLDADNALLRRGDLNYLTLNQGDQMLLSFPKIPQQTKRIYLVSKGFYISHQINSSVSHP
jgi:Helix-turn-helix domain